ncbi:MAG: SPOR domain-containing protein [Saprospiraceae bacterium]
MKRLSLIGCLAVIGCMNACKNGPDPGIDRIDMKDPIEEEGTVFDEDDLADLFEEEDTIEEFMEGSSPEESEDTVYTEAEEARAPVSPAPDVPASVEKGEFLVVAGSFSIKENAIAMQRQLQSLGYSTASIVYFNAREYHSVVAGEYASREEAEQVAGALRKAGIEAYAHKKRYIRKNG